MTATDVIVIGMGPGGEVVANKLAEAGLDVTGIDHRLIGGECAYWGCVPSKMMLHAAKLLAEGRSIADDAGSVDVDADWSRVADRVREATSDWDDSSAVEGFEARGGTFVRGEGRIVAPNRVEVDGRVFEASTGIVIATGTSPAIPPIDGLDATPFWTNREAIETEERPDSLIVLGGGAIGCELAQVFARFGTDVTIVEAEDRLQSSSEPEATSVIEQAFERDGITLRLGRRAERVAHDGATFTITLDDDTTLDAAQLLVVVGRSTDLEALGVDVLGIDVGQDFLPIDDRCRVRDGVWAIGDATGEALFTHVARHHAKIVIADVLDDDPPGKADHAIPHVTFTDPELAAVGLTEREAIERGIDVVTGMSKGGSRAWLVGRTDDALVKVVADRSSGVLIGATAVGPTGGEVLGLLALAVHARVPVRELRSMIYAYPTFHRAIDDALDDLDDLDVLCAP